MRIVTRTHRAPLLFIVIGAIAGVHSTGTPVFAQSATRAAIPRSVVWDRIDLRVELREDGTVHVTERNQVDFFGGPFHRGFREIPLARVEAIGNVRVGEVTDAGVRPYRFLPPGEFAKEAPNTSTSETVGQHVRIDWTFPSTTSQSRTFVIAYDAVGALRVYGDAEPPYQQLSWIGVDEELTRGASVNDASLTLILPRPVDPSRTVIQGPGSERPRGPYSGRPNLGLAGERSSGGGLAGGRTAVRAAGGGIRAVLAGSERPSGAAGDVSDSRHPSLLGDVGTGCRAGRGRENPGLAACSSSTQNRPAVGHFARREMRCLPAIHAVSV